MDDHVCIIADPCSDLHNVHHHNIGKFGLVTELDSLTGEVTFLDTDHSPVGYSSHFLLDEACLTTLFRFVPPPFLLESYSPDQSFSTPTDQRPENTDVISGPYHGFVRTVELISSSTVYLWTVAPVFPHIAVPVMSLIFLPPSNALRYLAEKGYNVRSGDAVEVVRGHQIGRRGIVGEIDFQKKILE